MLLCLLLACIVNFSEAIDSICIWDHAAAWQSMAACCRASLRQTGERGTRAYHTALAAFGRHPHLRQKPVRSTGPSRQAGSHDSTSSNILLQSRRHSEASPGTIRSSKITRCGLLLQEITLELMLLGSTAATQNSQLGPAHKKKFNMEQASGKEPGVASLACELLCHVARATNLPGVTRSVSLQTNMLAISNI